MLGLAPTEPHLVRTHRVQKKTRLAGTVRGIDLFSNFKCDRSHPHSVVIVSVVVNGKRMNRSKAAGAYPTKLCVTVAGLFAQRLEINLAPHQSLVQFTVRFLQAALGPLFAMYALDFWSWHMLAPTCKAAASQRSIE